MSGRNILLYPYSDGELPVHMYIAAYNIMLPLVTLTFIWLNIILYVLIQVISTCLLVLTNSDIAHLFLSLDLTKNLILLTVCALDGRSLYT